MNENKNVPLTYNIALWYGFILSVVFLIYGGVKLILSFLDRTYTDVGQLILFTIIGIVLITVAFAFKELKTWGWQGLMVINGIVILLALWNIISKFGNEDLLLYENMVLIIFSGVALYSLMAGQTKRYLSQ